MAKAVALSRINHSGTVFEVGQELQGIDGDALEALVSAGAAEIVTPPAPKKTVTKRASTKKD